MANQPAMGNMRVDTMLTNISIGYSNVGYIADQLAPIIPVQSQSGLIPEYDQSAWFRDEARLRSPRTRAARSGWTAKTPQSFYCPRYSLAHEIDDEERNLVQQPFDLDRDAVNFLTDKLQMRREVTLAAKIFTTLVWGADVAGGVDFTAWSDYGSSTPMADVTGYKDDIEAKIGREANTLVIGKPVYSKLKFHPDLVDTIKYTQRGMLSADLIQTLLELDKLLIGRAIYTTDPEGTAEASVTYSRIWGKAALLAYVPPNPGLMTPASMYTFVWQRVANAIQYFRRGRDDEREVDWIEGNTYFDQHIVGSRAGIYMGSVVA